MKKSFLNRIASFFYISDAEEKARELEVLKQINHKFEVSWWENKDSVRASEHFKDYPTAYNFFDHKRSHGVYLVKIQNDVSVYTKTYKLGE